MNQYTSTYNQVTNKNTHEPFADQKEEIRIMAKLKYSSVALAVVFLGGCVTTPTQVPDNVTTNENGIVDSISYSYGAEKEINFDYVKFCVARNVEYEGVTLSDSSGSFVGSATGTYYSSQNKKTEQARDIFIVLDDKNKFLVAQGTTFGGNVLGGLTSRVLNYNLSIEGKERQVSMTFDKIGMAQKNSGSIANTGFHDLATQFGSGFEGAYEGINSVAQNLKDCFKERL
jgi:hypothetical protein